MTASYSSSGNENDVKTDEKGAQQPSDDQPPQTLALPAPGDATATLAVGDDTGAVRFDHLGPLVVNTDGTLSRIKDWQNLSEGERERTLRLIGQRNKARMQVVRENEAQKQA